MKETTSPDAQYRIGAVSRLTGIPPVTIRMWERRYSVTTPQRTPAGDRLYSDRNVRRLSLLKIAVDNGNSISNAAKLSDSQLEAIAGQAPLPANQTNEPVRVSVIGDFLADALDDESQLPDNVAVASRFKSTDTADLPPETGTAATDVLVIEIPLLDEQTFKLAAKLRQRFGARHALVAYQFGTQKVTNQLNTLTIQAIKAPVSVTQLARSCVAIANSQVRTPNLPDSLERALRKPHPKKRFSDTELAKFSKMTNVVDCECPAHMTDIIRSLHAFENYSEQCENGNADDAAMHQMLHLVTAQARGLMEDAMQALIEHEHELIAERQK